MVGDTLRQAREQQGLTIADVAQETSIREAYLEAIENGNYDVLPGDVYAKGFIRNYSKFLQIDGDALLREYDSERNIVKAVQPVDMSQAQEQEPPKHKKSIFGKSNVKEIAPQEPTKVPEPPKPKAKLFASGDDYRHRLEREEKSGSRKFMILLAVMVVFLGGVYVAFMDDGGNDAAKNEPTVKTEQQNTEADDKIEGIEIKAKLLENCWISVKVDGTSVYEGTAEKGKEMTWKGKNTVEIVTGNAGGIEITENGKNIGKLGEAGQVAEKTFTAKIPGKDEPKSTVTTNTQQVKQESSEKETASSSEREYAAPAPQAETAAPAAVEPTPASASAETTTTQPAEASTPAPSNAPAAAPAPVENAAAASEG